MDRDGNIARGKIERGHFEIVSNGSQTVVQSDTGKISRRDAARVLFAATASSFVLPALALDHAVLHRIADAALSDSAEAALVFADWRPRVLTARQEESLRAIAEVMLPGSTKALVSRFIDLLLSVDTEVAQKQFIGSVAAIEEESSAKFSKSFATLSRHEQQSVLATISAAPRSGDPNSRMREHFEVLKEWIVPAYYSSEIGMRELGWTPDRVFPTYPTCAHAESHS